DPRANGRKRPFEHVPAGVELQLRAVVVVAGPERADDGDLVDAFGDVRPPVADLDARFAPLLETGLQRVELRLHLVLAGDDLADVFLEERGVERRLVRRLRDRLAGVLGQGGFRVEAFDVAGAADHEQPDYAFRLGREVRFTVGRRPSTVGRAG